MAWRAWQNIAATPATLQSVPTADCRTVILSQGFIGESIRAHCEFKQTTTENRFLYALSVFSDKKK